MVLEILCVEPIYPQYSGVLETCLALRYWFFEVLGSESVKYSSYFHIMLKLFFLTFCLVLSSILMYCLLYTFVRPCVGMLFGYVPIYSIDSKLLLATWQHFLKPGNTFWSRLSFIVDKCSTCAVLQYCFHSAMVPVASMYFILVLAF